MWSRRSPRARTTPQPDEITLVVAPAVEAGDATRQYGDYVTEHIDWNADDIESQDGEISEDDRKAEQDAQRLVTALDLAKEAGMRVVLMASTITGFTPDAYVQMSDAERIGAIQAQNIVDKLKLDTTSVENPKYVEVMLPRNTVSEDSSDADESEQETDEFACGDVSRRRVERARAVFPGRACAQPLRSADRRDHRRRLAFGGVRCLRRGRDRSRTDPTAGYG